MGKEEGRGREKGGGGVQRGRREEGRKEGREGGGRRDSYITKVQNQHNALYTDIQAPAYTLHSANILHSTLVVSIELV